MNNIQCLLFNKIKALIEPNLRMVDVIKDLLNIGSDSAYRRIRGTKELTLSELMILCSYFKVSLDSLMSEDSLIKYSYLNYCNVDSYECYVEDVFNYYNSLLKSKDQELIITAQEIPVFHLLPYTELIFFKYYARYRSLYECTISFSDFTSKLDRNRLTDYYEKIYGIYQQIPSTEIWSSHTIFPLLDTLNYYIDINCFNNKEIPLLLCKQFMQLIQEVERWAQNNCKSFNNNFKLYISPMDIQYDLVLTAKEDHINTTSIKLFHMNSIFSTSENFNLETEKWVKQTISKSLLISGTSERERFLYFETMKNKINDLISRIEKS